jgi:hypothetical protein
MGHVYTCPYCVCPQDMSNNESLMFTVDGWVATAFAGMPPGFVITQFANHLDADVLDKWNAVALEVVTRLYDVDMKYRQLRTEKNELIEVTKAVLDSDIEAGDLDDMDSTQNTLDRYIADLKLLDDQWMRISKSCIVQKAEAIRDAHTASNNVYPREVLGEVPMEDNLEARAFLRALDRIGHLAEQPIPDLEVVANEYNHPPPEPMARPEVVEVPDSDSDAKDEEEHDQQPVVLAPLPFRRDNASCRRRVLRGRSHKTYLDVDGITRLNTYTVEHYASRRFRAGRYGDDIGLVAQLCRLQERIELKIEELFPHKTHFVS